MDGVLDIEFEDGKVTLAAGEMFVVTKGVKHKPRAAQECKVLLVEPKGVVNTGDATSELKAENDVWI